MAIQFLSHRGLWLALGEQNTLAAFRRSLDAGFGIETDVRDAHGELVIAHDPPAPGAAKANEFLAECGARSNGAVLPIALNVKADGLAVQIRAHIEAAPGPDYFVFDMSVPDMRQYLREGVPTFGRVSDVEAAPPWLDRCAGVWLDALDADWIDAQAISRWLDRVHRVCIVSPELHNREHTRLWREIKSLGPRLGLMLCTDFPTDAKAFFE